LEFCIERHGDLRLRRHFHLGSPLLSALAQRTPVHRPVDTRADRADKPGREQQPDQQHPIGAVLAGKFGGNVFSDFRAGRLADIGAAVIHEIHGRTAAPNLGEVEQDRPQHEQHQHGDDRQSDGGQPRYQNRLQP
jgi:hypothetical protein